MGSIGEILRNERERRGLSVAEAHDATKITVQSIAALEENRFESFPNKVYARAFLRDYANYLSLDSVALLNAYEEKWSQSIENVPAPVRRQGGSGLRWFGYALLAVIALAALSFGGYYAWSVYDGQQHATRVERPVENNGTHPDVATIPKAQPITPPESEPSAKPKAVPTPVPAAPPPAPPQKAVLEVTALRPVWIQIDTDGKTAYMGFLKQSEKRTYEGKKSVYIKSGMAGAVQLKFNGQPQPPLGSLKTMGKKTFVFVESPAPATSAPSSVPPAPAPVGSP